MRRRSNCSDASERVVGELHERLAARHQDREVRAAARQQALHVEARGGELGLVERRSSPVVPAALAASATFAIRAHR